MSPSHNDTPGDAPVAPTSTASAAPFVPSSPSLYVGNLAPEATEAILFEIFKTAGPIVSIRVCRDAVIRRSLGYAYVNYNNLADAENALNTLNFTPIVGRPCRIMWSQRDPSKRKTGVGNIFIKNLDKSIDTQNLNDTFSAFGNILSCKVETDAAGQSKGYGYVHYEKQAEADLAIARVNNMMLAGKVVYVGPFTSRKDRAPEEQDKKFSNAFVKNLSEEVTEDQLRDAFAKFGVVMNAVVMRDEVGKSKGFGFVSFGVPEEAAKAVEAMNGQTLGQRVVYVGRAQKKSEREEELKTEHLEALQKHQGVNLYVKNLADSITEERLRTEFERFGNITSTKVMIDERGNSKGFGFVCFSSADEATRAVTEMNGTLLGSKPLYVGLAQRRDVRRSQLEAQHAQQAVARATGMPGPGMRMPPMMAPQMYPAPPMFHPGPMQRMYPSQPGMPRPPRFAQGGPAAGPRGPGPHQRRSGPPMTGPGGAGARPRQPHTQPAQGPAGPIRNGPAPVMSALGLPPADQIEAVMGADGAKQALGEQVYMLISRTQPDLAAKITGMFLDSLPVRELYDLLLTPASMEGKIGEALRVLDLAQAPISAPASIEQVASA
eukprot:TRINITY_DN1516_c0_g1_i1.p2 TRINITY_DN1516_c0_g1~~TRINITY_DN1516_c0_g1_i1.p2  ORF type:complete len:604 (-),score=189.46 TRINITY_DN1516_c0_g1_i1:60-1871(-)